MAENQLYYGDNLDILPRYLKDGAVDLVYLDPPFKSNQDYNVLFAEKDGSRSAAQIKAFEDTWQWDQAAAEAYHEIVEHGGKVSQAMQAFRTFLGESDMLAYLAMMAPRLVELRRVLKPTGSIYLHCDPTASHYLKMLMDAVFGPEQFLNEVIWRRTGPRTPSAPAVWDVSMMLFSSMQRDKANIFGIANMFRFQRRHKKRHYHAVDAAGRVFTHGELPPWHSPWSQWCALAWVRYHGDWTALDHNG